MAKFVHRFGKRIPIPSTVEIKQAFKQHVMMEAHRARWAAEEVMPANATWNEIIEHRSLRLAALEQHP